ncbi:MAG TPA: hypothetical protein VJN96_12170 [Vicinamibacterales bacterium]|nr:hypothetical protein [Vicinamibacterales bacterium]
MGKPSPFASAAACSLSEAQQFAHFDQARMDLLNGVPLRAEFLEGVSHLLPPPRMVVAATTASKRTRVVARFVDAVFGQSIADDRLAQILEFRDLAIDIARGLVVITGCQRGGQPVVRLAPPHEVRRRGP